MATLARKGQQIFMTTFSTSDPGKAIVQDATIEITVNALFYIRTEEAVFVGKALIPAAGLQGFEMVLNTLIILEVSFNLRNLSRCELRFANCGLTFVLSRTWC